MCSVSVSVCVLICICVCSVYVSVCVTSVLMCDTCDTTHTAYIDEVPLLNIESTRDPQRNHHLSSGMSMRDRWVRETDGYERQMGMRDR